MPGLRFKLWPIFGVKKFPWVQVPAGEIGVVIAQVGEPLPIGAKSAVYKPEFGNFSDLRRLHRRRRAEGCAAPGAAAGHVAADPPGRVPGDHGAQGLRPCRVARISSSGCAAAGGVLRAGDVRAHARAAPGRGDRAGRPARRRSASSPRSKVSRCPSGDIASRLGGFDDIAAMEQQENAVDSRDHRGAARQQERRCTTTTRTSRRSSTTAARSVCSTTRCSTARTC